MGYYARKKVLYQVIQAVKQHRAAIANVEWPSPTDIKKGDNPRVTIWLKQMVWVDSPRTEGFNHLYDGRPTEYAIDGVYIDVPLDNPQRAWMHQAYSAIYRLPHPHGDYGEFCLGNGADIKRYAERSGGILHWISYMIMAAQWYNAGSPLTRNVPSSVPTKRYFNPRPSDRIERIHLFRPAGPFKTDLEVISDYEYRRKSWHRHDMAATKEGKFDTW